MTRTIQLSNNDAMDCDLVVYRDWVEGTGQWRLFWANQADPFKGVVESSAVTGDPFFRTRTAAVAYGEQRYGLTAKTAEFHLS